MDETKRREIKFIKDLLTKVEECGKLPIDSVAKEYIDLFSKNKIDYEKIKGFIAIQSNYLHSTTIEANLAKEDKNKKTLVDKMLRNRAKFYSKYPMLLALGTEMNWDFAPQVCKYIQLMES